MAASQALWDDLKASYPWIAELGLSMAWVQKTLAESNSAQEIAAEIRKTAQWKKRFPGIMQGSSMIMSEAEYVRTEKDYRQLFRQFGKDKEYTTPESLAALFQNGVDPNELRDRLTVWRQVVSPEGKAFRDAFYVYTGSKISERDLYRATVDPTGWRQVEKQLASGAMRSDYPTFIDRATQVAQDNIANKIGDWVKSGLITQNGAAQIMAGNPEFSRQLMDALATGGTGDTTQLIPLQDLLEAFENAMVGSAATESGLGLPAKERLAQFRAAGIERAKLIQGYRDFGRNQTAIAAAVQRARGTAFGQRQFEEAEFLGNAAASQDLEGGFAYMQGIGRDQGNFRFTEQGGRISQRGFSNY